MRPSAASLRPRCPAPHPTVTTISRLGGPGSTPRPRLGTHKECRRCSGRRVPQGGIRSARSAGELPEGGRVVHHAVGDLAAFHAVRLVDEGEGAGQDVREKEEGKENGDKKEKMKKKKSKK